LFDGGLHKNKQMLSAYTIRWLYHSQKHKNIWWYLVFIRNRM